MDQLLKGITGQIGAAAKSATSFVVQGAATKLGEGLEAGVKSLGSIVSFKKVSVNSLSVEKLSAEIIKGGSPIDSKALIGDVMGGYGLSNEASASASQVKGAAGVSGSTSQHRVTLTENGTTNVVTFESLPEIVEQHTAEYEAIAPPQSPGAFQKYKGSSTTNWTLNATFVSRSEAEAERNYRFLMMLRGWTKPFHGERTAEKFKNKLGAPPPVLTMAGLRNLVGPIPVVITALNWNWPRDVDYISTTTPGPDGKPVPFPTVLSVSIQLVESFSVEQFNNFSLADYRAGKMGPAFNKTAAEVAQARQSAQTQASLSDGEEVVSPSAIAALPPSSPPEPPKADVAALQAVADRMAAEMEAIKAAGLAATLALPKPATEAQLDAAVEYRRANVMQYVLKERERDAVLAKIKEATA